MIWEPDHDGLGTRQFQCRNIPLWSLCLKLQPVEFLLQVFSNRTCHIFVAMVILFLRPLSLLLGLFGKHRAISFACQFMSPSPLFIKSWRTVGNE